MSQKLNIKTVFKKANEISSQFLPLPNLTFSDKDIEFEKIELISSLLAEVLSDSTDFILQVFEPKEQVAINLGLTSGFPAPYDAWTAHADFEDWIFFNLSQWSIENLKLNFKSILKHEISHVLTRPYLPNNINSEVDQLKAIALDEGLAHFISALDQDHQFISNNMNRMADSEREFEKAIQALSTLASAEQKNEILLRSNTGPFWEKFAAIAGMFWVHEIFVKSGVKGLREMLSRGSLFEVSK